MPPCVICLFVSEAGIGKLGYNWLQIVYLPYVLYELACLFFRADARPDYCLVYVMSSVVDSCSRVGATTARLHLDYGIHNIMQYFIGTYFTSVL